MTIREKFSTTSQSIQSLRDNTPDELYDFILVDCGLPEEITGNILKSDTTVPQLNRIQAIKLVKTQYTIFVDNDIIFEKEWLPNLLKCAEETDAGIVAPVYLWKTDKIHMFGGTIKIKNKCFYEKHELVNVHKNILKTLKRKKCDYIEYHCLLMKTELHSLLDPNYTCVHEHIDLCLKASELGHEIYTEPTSIVTYLNDAKLKEYDVPFFKSRWDSTKCERDIEYFCKKWDFSNTTFDDVRNFVKTHVATLSP